MTVLISDNLVQAAFDWLRENAAPSAAAKAARIRAEHNTKRVKAKQFLEASGSVAERDATAIASDEYLEAVDGEASAVEADEFHRNQRNKAEAIIEAWRTEQASMRAIAKVG